MSKLPSWEVYANYASGNYGAHALCFTDADGNDYYFSYKTLVAFRRLGHPVVVHQNDWRQTTGRHLNAIDDGNKKARVDGATFARLFQEQFGRKLAA